MNAVSIETMVEADGELHLRDLPCRRGDKVEAIVLVLEQSSSSIVEVERERARAAALERFLTLARPSAFRSAGPYPTRAELHERH
jgi:hypothetical protein